MSDPEIEPIKPEKPIKTAPFKSKRQPMLLTCKNCTVTAALSVDPNSREDWPQHRCRKTMRPAPFTAAKLDKENRHMPVWKI
jgi:hypothetical protein